MRHSLPGRAENREQRTKRPPVYGPLAAVALRVAVPYPLKPLGILSRQIPGRVRSDPRGFAN